MVLFLLFSIICYYLIRMTGNIQSSEQEGIVAVSAPVLNYNKETKLF